MRRPFSTTRRDDGVTVAPAPSAPETSSARRRRSIFIRSVTSIVIVALIAVFLAGVATNRLPRLPGSGGATTGPVRGGSIVYAILADTTNLIPNQPNLGVDGTVDVAIWAPLWYSDASNAFHAALATEVPSPANGGISDDLKTWTIHIKPNLKWSDDSPLTAADVAFSLNTFADAHFANTQGFPIHDPSDPIDFLGATVLDSMTVQFTLAHPYVGMAALLADGNSAPIPREVFGTMQSDDIAKSHEGFFPTVTSGPFKVGEHVQGDHLTVVRNPYYYQGPDKPYLDQITFRPFPHQEDVVSAFRADRLDAAFSDMSSLTPLLLDSYRALSGYTTYLANPGKGGYELSVFNLTNPILSDKLVRQALTMSLDPKQISALGPPGLFVPVCDDQAGTWADEPNLTCYPQDSARARQLLDADGWTLGTDGVRHKDGKTLELTYSSVNVNAAHPERAKVETLAQTSWAQIGVKLDIQNYGQDEFFNGILPSASFDIAEFGFGGGTDPDDHWLFMCNQTPDNGGNNFMRYCNQAVDQAEIVQQSNADQATRMAAFQTIHRAILYDLPVMYYYAERSIGVYRSTLRNTDRGFWEWYVARP